MTCPRPARPDAHLVAAPRSGSVRRPADVRRRGRGVVAAVLVVGLLAGCGGAPARPTPSGPVLQDDGSYRAEVVMRDMAFVPAEVTVPSGATLEIVVTNEDGMPHDLVLDDGSATPLLSRGEQASLTVVVADDVAGWCSVVGHREAGMVLDLRAG